VKVLNTYILITVAILCFSCSNNNTERVVTSPVITDSITILADPSWKKILQTLINTYEGLNPTKKIILMVKPESECIQDILSDSFRMAFVTRDFSIEENKFLQGQQWHVRNDTLCYDGITWIVSKSFPADSISISEVQTLFQTGKFDGIPYTLQLNDIGSSIANYLSRYFGNPISTQHIYKGGQDQEIINSVKGHTTAIGCISSSTLVNLKNKANRSNFESIKILKINTSEDTIAYSSFQNDLALGTYPFIRVLRVLNHDAPSGLGTAFASFIIHNRGQRLLLKEGLLPFKMPAREIELKNH
jgi:phosphate transport system substrate-binding protein